MTTTTTAPMRTAAMGPTPMGSAPMGGIVSAPITPFHGDFSLDEEGLRRNVAVLAREGADAIAACGSIGEHPVLSEDEWDTAVRLTVEGAREGGGVPVYVTVGHTDMRVVRRRIVIAREAGAAGLVVTPPYYFPLSIDELIDYYHMIADQGVPFLAYNNPTTGGPVITPEALAAIADLPGFVGLKEATPNVMEFVQKRAILEERAPIIAAAETQVFFMLMAGADGCLTATATVAPGFLRPMWQAAQAGDVARTRAEYRRLLAFRRIVDAENRKGRAGYLPVAKAAMELRGLAGGPPRPPVRPLGESERRALADVMVEHLGLDLPR